MKCIDCIHYCICGEELGITEDDNMTANLCAYAEAKRPKGKWIKEKGCLLAYRCSNCKKLMYSREAESDEKFEDLSRLDGYRYCPRCGARMENNL